MSKDKKGANRFNPKPVPPQGNVGPVRGAYQRPGETTAPRPLPNYQRAVQSNYVPPSSGRPVQRPAPAGGVGAKPPITKAPPAATPAPEPAPEKAAVDLPVRAVDPNAKIVMMKPPLVVSDLAAKMNLKPHNLVHELMEIGIFVGPKGAIDEETARKVCTRMGWTFEVEKREKGAGQVHAPVKVVEPPKPEPTPTDLLEPRPPVITFMGHVDHGKTSLLDALRSARVAAGEAGGITQHIGAYTIKVKDQTITFLDTPGHEAFTSMRARGANITDIVVLVVAADDGLMPQTLEALSHARAAKVAIMVAINKIDLPAANILKVKAQLQEQGLVPEDYGGDTIFCEVSATKRLGIDHLLEMMLLQAELLELKANPKGPARGTIIEAQFEQGRGATATALVQSGTLCTGDNIIVGPYYGRVRALVNDIGKPTKEAGPAIPVKIIGLNGAPNPGEELVVMKTEREVRELGEERAAKLRLGKLETGPRVRLEDLLNSLKDKDKKVLNIILKGDVQGSVEAVAASLRKIQSKKIDLEIIHQAVGPISESDILLAKASDAVVIGFNTKTDNAAANAAKREDVQIKLYSIIYELIDQVRDAMIGMLDPELRESQLGTIIVKQVFALSKFPVAGCLVQNGRIVRNARARVLRRRQPIYDGQVVALKRFQDEASEVRAGLECGVRLGDFNEYQVDDIIECYQLEKVTQAL
ncbi:translation initiation factor IF-2 [Verrucomicrobia bacterium LW23]|nr:translation initiation factor IF-2 [Verrucomicrobia bacterium LW23]